jgi:2-dehydro-3-deoxyphosphogluconate aldolase/(4S)-4-hydroxy-2-oxoglutarate aldolase
MKKTPILELIESEGLLPLFTHEDMPVAKFVLKAFYEAGGRVFEYTNRHKEALLVFQELRSFVNDHLPDLMLGAGTIKTGEEAQQFIDAGADFLISPLINSDVFSVADKNKTMWIPGCATASEIGQAEAWGIPLVKLFPATQLGGPAFVKALRAVFPHIGFVATGGIKAEISLLHDWFRSGVIAVGIGSELIPKDLLQRGDKLELITYIKKVREMVLTAKQKT